ncbi:MAG: putative toxin-antitoxin system toxin component, PIN family [Dyadobacter fermentans]
MPDKLQRVIIDTNLWISFLISGSERLEQLLLSGKVALIFSEELVSEFVSVASRPKFARFFDSQSIEELLTSIREVATFIVASSQIKLCRDAKDDFLLALALDSNADFLITGNSDLLEMQTIGRTRIITLTNFLEQK